MRFPYGTAPLAILILALLSSAALLAMEHAQSHAQRRPDLVMAIFDQQHFTADRPAIEEFEKENGVTIDLELVDQKALQDRLQSALQVGAQVPDMVELLYDTLGIFSKGPLSDVQFIDLTDRIHSSGLYDQLVQNRFTKWESRGHIFALPNDVHPVMLAYRRDLIEQLGIDVNQLTTWDKFSEIGRDVVARSRDASGVVSHYMIDLPTDGNDPLRLLMLQDGVTLFNADGDVGFDNEKTVDVFCWYVKQVQGPGRIAFPCGWGTDFSRAVIDGVALFYLTPDWRTNSFEHDIPSVSGKMALIPMPAWTPGGLRTSTWGGTGLAFPKQCRNFELAWKLAMYLYYNPQRLAKNFAVTNILPPLKSAWTLPIFSQPNPYFSGEPLGKLYAALAPFVPRQYDNAFSNEGVQKISDAYTATSEYYAAHGDSGLREYARIQIKTAADGLRRLMARNVFLEPRAGPAPGETR